MRIPGASAREDLTAAPLHRLPGPALEEDLVDQPLEPVNQPVPAALHRLVLPSVVVDHGSHPVSGRRAARSATARRCRRCRRPVRRLSRRRAPVTPALRPSSARVRPPAMPEQPVPSVAKIALTACRPSLATLWRSGKGRGRRPGTGEHPSDSPDRFACPERRDAARQDPAERCRVGTASIGPPRGGPAVDRRPSPGRAHGG